MAGKPKTQQEADDFSWVAARRPGNIRIVWYIVAFCLCVLLYSAWSFVRFMETRTGYSRFEQTQQSGDL